MNLGIAVWVCVFLYYLPFRRSERENQNKTKPFLSYLYNITHEWKRQQHRTSNFHHCHGFCKTQLSLFPMDHKQPFLFSSWWIFLSLLHSQRLSSDPRFFLLRWTCSNRCNYLSLFSLFISYPFSLLLNSCYKVLIFSVGPFTLFIFHWLWFCLLICVFCWLWFCFFIWMICWFDCIEICCISRSWNSCNWWIKCNRWEAFGINWIGQYWG